MMDLGAGAVGDIATSEGGGGSTVGSAVEVEEVDAADSALTITSPEARRVWERTLVTLLLQAGRV